MKLKFTINLFALLSLGAFSLKAQDMPGFRTDNYNGVNGVFFNPANAADSRYQYDIGILGLSGGGSNNNLNFSYGKFFDLISDTGIVNRLVGHGSKSSAMFNLAAYTPSFMINVTPTTTVGFVSRTRAMLIVTDFDGNLISAVQNDLNQNPPYQINNNANMRLSVNAWSEYGATVGQVLLNEGNHFLKGGLTLKYLAGIANAYMNVNRLQGSVDVDNAGKTYLTNTSGGFAMGVGGLDINNLDDARLDYSGNGMGMDLGFVYEYRPDEFKDMPNKYLFKVTAAVLDIGSIKYKRIGNSSADFQVHIPSGQQFYLDNFDGSIADYKATMDKYKAYFTQSSGSDGSYKVSLPTTLQLGVDVRAYDRIYASLYSQIALVNNKSKAYNPMYVSTVTVTPRYERSAYAFYLPVSYNSLTNMNLGFGFRAGPVYAGSASLLGSLLGFSKQVDFYFGFRAGLKRSAAKTVASAGE